MTNNISAEAVRQLREETGAGMMDCKSALVEAAGDAEKARDLLRKKGLAAAAKKAGRSATDGIIGSYVHPGAKVAVMVEVNCETDFVAKTPDFQQLVKDIAMHVAASAPLYVSKDQVPADVLDRIAEGKLKDYYAQFCLLEQPFVKDGKVTVGQLVQEKIAIIKENIVVRRFARFKVGEDAQAAKATAE